MNQGSYTCKHDKTPFFTKMILIMSTLNVYSKNERLFKIEKTFFTPYMLQDSTDLKNT